MLTKPVAMALYRKLAYAPQGWLASNDGQRLLQKSIAHVRAIEGDSEADTFENLLTVAEVLDSVAGGVE